MKTMLTTTRPLLLVLATVLVGLLRVSAAENITCPSSVTAEWGTAEWFSVPGSTWCYLMSASVWTTWDDADQLCADNDGWLVQFEDVSQYVIVRDYVIANSIANVGNFVKGELKNQVWGGAHWDASFTLFTWRGGPLDGVEPDPIFWSDGPDGNDQQPDFSGLCMQWNYGQNQAWDDLGCTVDRKPMCQTYRITDSPTVAPTPVPTSYPTYNPTPYPTPYPTYNPTQNPTPQPTQYPTENPTPNPTQPPTPYPTYSPTPLPTPAPTTIPSAYEEFSQCPRQWTYIDGWCYMFSVFETHNQSLAQRICNENGGWLVQFTTEPQYWSVLDAMYNDSCLEFSGYDRVFMGAESNDSYIRVRALMADKNAASKRDAEFAAAGIVSANYHWSGGPEDGNDVLDTLWAPQQPDGSGTCTQFNFPGGQDLADALWDDVPCSYDITRLWVCQSYAATTTPSPTVFGGASLLDSAETGQETGALNTDTRRSQHLRDELHHVFAADPSAVASAAAPTAARASAAFTLLAIAFSAVFAILYIQ